MLRVYVHKIKKMSTHTGKRSSTYKMCKSAQYIYMNKCKKRRH